MNFFTFKHILLISIFISNLQALLGYNSIILNLGKYTLPLKTIVFESFG